MDSARTDDGTSPDVADAQRDRLLHVLVHELRNPLAPIQNAVEVLKLSRPVSERVDRCSDLIDRQVSRMVQLLDDLLDVNRIARGSFEVRSGQVDLRSLLEQVLRRSETDLAEHGHTLVAELPPSGVELTGDAPMLVRLFTNLLDNAVKFTDRGGTITLGHAVGPDTVLVTIADSGIGIEPEIAARMFEPFALAGSSHNHQGNRLGLGLPLAKGIVEAHGGQIEMHSRGPGQGTEFHIQLPVRVAAHEAMRQAPGPQAGNDTAAPERWRMVLADDRVLNADSLSELIRLQGHDVITVYDGEAAVVAAQQSRPNVVVLDIGMPGMDGFEACRRIRAESWGRDIPIIALTGWGQVDVANTAREAGFTRHLLKPVDHLTLLGSLEQWRNEGAGDTG